MKTFVCGLRYLMLVNSRALVFHSARTILVNVYLLVVITQNHVCLLLFRDFFFIAGHGICCLWFTNFQLRLSNPSAVFFYLLVPHHLSKDSVVYLLYLSCCGRHSGLYYYHLDSGPFQLTAWVALENVLYLRHLLWPMSAQLTDPWFNGRNCPPKLFVWRVTKPISLQLEPGTLLHIDFGHFTQLQRPAHHQLPLRRPLLLWYVVQALTQLLILFRRDPKVHMTHHDVPLSSSAANTTNNIPNITNNNEVQTAMQRIQEMQQQLNAALGAVMPLINSSSQSANGNNNVNNNITSSSQSTNGNNNVNNNISNNAVPNSRSSDSATRLFTQPNNNINNPLGQQPVGTHILSQVARDRSPAADFSLLSSALSSGSISQPSAGSSIMPAIPKSAIDKIRSGEFVNFDTLLPCHGPVAHDEVYIPSSWWLFRLLCP